VDIFDTRGNSSLKIRPFVRDCPLIPEDSKAAQARQRIEAWFRRPHFKLVQGREASRPPWIYDCPIAPALAGVLAAEDPEVFAQAIAEALQKCIPEDNPILGKLRITPRAGGWLSFDVQAAGVRAWLATEPFVNSAEWLRREEEEAPPPPLINSVAPVKLNSQQLWACQHHHARLCRHQAVQNHPKPDDLPETEWGLLGAFLDAIDQLDSHPIDAALGLKLADRLVQESDRVLVGQTWPADRPLSSLQTKTQQLLAWILIEGCGQIAPTQL
jgi:hypothetical protein